MESLKKIVFLAFFLAVFIDNNVKAKDLVIGSRQSSDDLACFERVHKRAKENEVLTTIIRCYVSESSESINFINAQDLGSPGKGGYSLVIEGGISKTFVTILLMSQLSQPLDFTVTVFAKKDSDKQVV